MKTEILTPRVQTVGGVQPVWGISAFAAEPSLFSCSFAEARVRGGPLTGEILDAVEAHCSVQMMRGYEHGLHEVIDVRVQRLMPGMFPSIPGWHCDAVPRANYFAQPDFSKLSPASFHVTCLMDSGGGVSNTVFLRDSISFTFDDGQPVWQQLHRQIESAPHRCEVIKPGDLVLFDSRSPHKTAPCAKRGWRLFFRLSMYHNPPIANAVTSQQQVYILSEENGW